jgi:hypothetical protein
MGKIGFLNCTSWIGTSSSSTGGSFIRSSWSRWSSVRKDWWIKIWIPVRIKEPIIIHLSSSFSLVSTLFYSLKKGRLPIEPPEWVVLLLFFKQKAIPACTDGRWTVYHGDHKKIGRITVYGPSIPYTNELISSYAALILSVIFLGR